MSIVWPIILMTALGVAFGLLLGYAGKKFAVEVDERVPRVREALPGANCGGCGYAGCDALAEAIVSGEAKVNACPVGGADTANAIADILGVEKTTVGPQKAYVFCNGSLGNTREQYKYEGVQSCAAVNTLAGGAKSCRFACLGMGDCARACPFGAISVENQKAVVDYAKCTGCGVCAGTCPKGVIQVMPQGVPVFVSCRNTDPGKQTREVCTRGCIGCKKCERTCEYGAIHVMDGFSVVDVVKCTGCGACVAGCPTGCISHMV